MPAKKSTGLAALHQVEVDRVALAKREREAREAAALEVGHAVLGAVGSSFTLDELTQLLKAARQVGYGAAVEALGGTPKARAKRSNGAAEEADRAAV